VKSRIRVLLLALAFFVAIPASGQTGLSASAHAATGDAPTSTPIKHFIFLMQENHSFDNYFGTYPGADGPPPGTCIPVDPTRPGGRCVEPFRVGGRAITDLGHSRLVHDEQFRGGQMDGFVAAAGLVGSENGRIATTATSPSTGTWPTSMSCSTGSSRPPRAEALRTTCTG